MVCAGFLSICRLDFLLGGTPGDSKDRIEVSLCSYDEGGVTMLSVCSSVPVEFELLGG